MLYFVLLLIFSGCAQRSTANEVSSDSKPSAVWFEKARGRIYVFRGDQFEIFDSIPGYCIKRNSSFYRFPEDLRQEFINKIMSPSEGSRSVFEESYGKIVESESGAYYEKKGERNYLSKMESLPEECLEATPKIRLSLANFEALVKIFQHFYPDLSARGVDWKKTVIDGRKNFEKVHTQSQFLSAVKTFLAPLRDSHVKVFFYTGSKRKLEPEKIVDWETTEGMIPDVYKHTCHAGKSCYETQKKNYWSMATKFLDPRSLHCVKAGTVLNGDACLNPKLLWVWGTFDEAKLNFQGQKIAYIAFRQIKDLVNPKTKNADRAAEFDGLLNVMIHDLQETGAVILDNRLNEGGSDEFSKLLAARMSTEKAFAYEIWPKQDPEHKVRKFIAPAVGKPMLIKPTALLMDVFTGSAAEMLVLFLQTQKHVVKMGRPTEGIFSSMLSMELSNGLVVTLPFQVTVDAEGKMMEGRGIVPHQIVDFNDPSSFDFIIKLLIKSQRRHDGRLHPRR